MSTAITITNPRNKKKQKAKNIKSTSFEEYNLDGELETNKYVQYTVVGKNREWTDFMSLQDFKKLNPDVKID